MSRARTARRAQARIDAKKKRRMGKELEARGLGDRLRAVALIVGEHGSPLFWSVLKQRIAARELLRNFSDLEPVRAEAMKVLAMLGVDMTGLQLKLDWQRDSQQLFITPALTIETAADIVHAVQQRDPGVTAGG